MLSAVLLSSCELNKKEEPSPKDPQKEDILPEGSEGTEDTDSTEGGGEEFETTENGDIIFPTLPFA